MAAAFRKRLHLGVFPTYDGKSSYASQPYSETPERDSKHYRAVLLSEIFWILINASVVGLFILFHLLYSRFPTPPNSEVHELGSVHWPRIGPWQDIQSGLGGFVEQNARQILDDICAHGSRNVGSLQNEEIAFNYIQDRVRTIQRNTKTVHVIEMDVQSATGCFDLDFIGGFTSCYTNVKNILVRFAPRQGASSGVLVNCHYDTAFSSPGASDDLVSCAIMLDVLRVLSQSEKPYKHSIIFNFNGAEETILQASHGFITQHKWSKEVRAFVNLEASGSGGRELVFQTGPENPWLVKLYAGSVKHPFASVFAQEVFQSGVIPSDTDFRIYRDYGKIPGIDIAYTYNGYIYHTIYDQPKYIPQGCIQRAGENLLGLLSKLADADELADPGEARLGKMVFFDFLGFFMIYYPQRLGEIINWSVVAVVLLNLYRKLKAFSLRGVSRSQYAKLIGACYTTHAVGFVSMAVVVLLLAATHNILRPMMWFTRSWLIIPMYCFPAIASWILAHHHGKAYFGRLFQTVSVWDLEGVFFEAAILFWTLLLAVMTAYGLSSAYMCMLWVAFPMIFRLLTADVLKIKMYEQPVMYLTLTLASLLVPGIHLMQLVHSIFIVFIPLMGRIGSEVQPDLIIASFSLLVVLFFTIYPAGFFHVSKPQNKLAYKIFAVYALITGLGVITPLGFPYSGNIEAPSAQRHVVHHYSRDLHNLDGSLNRSDFGLLYIPLDYSGARYIGHIPEIAGRIPESCDINLAYCGWPYYIPFITHVKELYSFPMQKPRLNSSISVTFSKGPVVDSRRRIIVLARGGQIHVNIFISPRDGVELVGWSFTSGVPVPTEMPTSITRKHYFVYTTSAEAPHPDRSFWLDVKLPAYNYTSDGCLDIAFGAHYLAGSDSQTAELKRVLDQFPDWTVPIGWPVTIQHYRI